MKKKGHPPYQDIIFLDTATGEKFVCGSTLQPKDKDTFEGKDYPVYKVAVSSKSHPFFTGNQQYVDAEGRVDKFNKKYANKKVAADKLAEKEKEKNDEMKTEKRAKKLSPAVKVVSTTEPSEGAKKPSVKSKKALPTEGGASS
jgi:large subunit ribosomal protein L31